MAYIDSEIAKRRQAQTTTTFTNPVGTDKVSISQNESSPQAPVTSPPPSIPPRQNPHHQLSEVDLGPSSTVLNTHQPPGASPIPQITDAAPDRPPRKPRRKPRLGRDGKPLRPRPPRKRRPSEDIARDALVEQVLHEHKLENVYQPPPPPTLKDANKDTAGKGAGDDGDGGEKGQDADEAFAERFRQDFLDQIAERKQAQGKKKKTTATGGAERGADKDKEKSSHGPKLGGSRAARAKMAALQAAQKEGGAGEKKK